MFNLMPFAIQFAHHTVHHVMLSMHIMYMPGCIGQKHTDIDTSMLVLRLV